MLASLYCGTSGYSYPTWKPGFYPATLPAKRFLSHYATRLNAVESNYTFRSLPTAQTLANWIADTPPGFLFAAKAHQSITHFRRQPPAGSMRAFLDALEPLREAGRLGPVLLQFPPTRPADPEALAAILGAAPAGLRLAFEFRHPSWFADPVYALLREHGAALCLAESDTLATPPVLTAGFVYFRLRKSAYSPAELRAIARETTRLREDGREVFLFFMHQDEPTGPAYAEAILHPPMAAAR